MNKKNLIIILLLSTIFILWVTLQIVSNNLYQNSLSLDKAEQEINTFRHENNSLKLKLLQNEAYIKIDEKAKLSGFIPAPFITP